MNERLKYDINVAVVVGERNIAEISELFCFYWFFSKQAYIASVL